MNTKAEERAALEKIKKILASLDPDGYVNAAFKGCVTDAENNIENDWVLSMTDRLQSARNECAMLEAKIESKMSELSRTCKIIDALQTVAITDDTMLSIISEALAMTEMYIADIAHKEEIAILDALNSGEIDEAIAHNNARNNALEKSKSCIVLKNKLAQVREAIANGVLKCLNGGD